MAKPLSLIFVAASWLPIDGGLSCRQAAAQRFGVSASSAIRWSGPATKRGETKPKPQWGVTACSGSYEAHATFILRPLADTTDITLPS